MIPPPSVLSPTLLSASRGKAGYLRTCVFLLILVWAGTYGEGSCISSKVHIFFCPRTLGGHSCSNLCSFVVYLTFTSTYYIPQVTESVICKHVAAPSLDLQNPVPIRATPTHIPLLSPIFKATTLLLTPEENFPYVCL